MRYVICLLVVFLFCFISESQAAEPEEIKAIIEFMHSASVKGVIHRENYESGAVQIVFIEKELRYTFYCSGHSGDSKVKFLSVWVRPNGTSDRGQLFTFTDDDLDGQVEFGMIAAGGEYYRAGEEGEKGEKFRSNWQGQYDRAIKDAVQRLLK